MKRFFAICFCALMTVCVGCAQSASLPAVQKGASGAALPLAQSYVGADFGGGEYSYMLEAPITDGIDTFEACIRMENNRYTQARSSVIFGNYTTQTENKNYINYEITAEGFVSTSWAGAKYVFSKAGDVRTGEWLHLAVVRDEEKQQMRVYYDGELKQTIDGVPTVDPLGNYFEHFIGSDGRDSAFNCVFLGEIGHVACYRSALTKEEIVADFENVSLVSGATRSDDLIFAAMLTLGQNDVLDRSASFNNALISTSNYFYEGELFDTADYTFAVVGDTQRLARQAEQSYQTITNWIVDNAADRKIARTLFMGDLSDSNGSMGEAEWRGQWEVVDRSLKVLDGKVPYVTIPGNHDYLNDVKARDLTMYNEYLPYEKFAAQTGFGGAYEVGCTQNIYYTQTLAGVKYLYLALEFGPEPSVMEWACDVIEAHADHRVIVMTHGFLDETGELYDDGKYLSAYWYFSRSGTPATSSQTMWEKYLARYENVFMILCGHSAESRIQYKSLVGEKGNTVMTFMIDMSYTVGAKGHDSAISLITIDESTSTLWLNTFSAGKNRLFNVQNQMKINFKTYERSVGAYYGEGMVAV